MYKVVYNNCFGGFGLSEEAKQLGRELSGDSNWGDYEYDLSRHDPILVQVVEQLGSKANDFCADLEIEEVRGVYRIEEYDGNESVQEPDDILWIQP